MNEAAQHTCTSHSHTPHAEQPGDVRRAMSQFCLQKCPTSGCSGVCNQLAEYVNHTHRCPAGHTWR